jgi:hypothetical protein
MKNNNLIIVSLLLFVAIGCDSSDTKSKINKVGNVTGQVVGELASGVAEGVEKSLSPKIELSEKLKNTGIEFGKILVKSDNSGTDNLLVVYMVFNKDYKGTLFAKVYDNANLEMGRVKVNINCKKDDAKYIDFLFDKQTNIDKDSKIIIE